MLIVFVAGGLSWNVYLHPSSAFHKPITLRGFYGTPNLITLVEVLCVKGLFLIIVSERFLPRCNVIL